MNLIYSQKCILVNVQNKIFYIILMINIKPHTLDPVLNQIQICFFSFSDCQIIPHQLYSRNFKFKQVSSIQNKCKYKSIFSGHRMPPGSNSIGILGFQFQKIFKNKLFLKADICSPCSKKFNLVFPEVPSLFAYLKEFLIKQKGSFHSWECLEARERHADIRDKYFSCYFFLSFLSYFFCFKL